MYMISLLEIIFYLFFIRQIFYNLANEKTKLKIPKLIISRNLVLFCRIIQIDSVYCTVVIQRILLYLFHR